jgi:hypothetical protein
LAGETLGIFRKEEFSMTRVQTAIAKFEAAIRKTINEHRSAYLPYAAIIGVIAMVSADINHEADKRQEDGTL